MRRLLWVLVVLVAICACGFLVVSCAGAQTPRSEEDAWARFVGEWENTEYANVPPSFPKRRTIAPDYSITDHYGGTDYRIPVKPVRYFGDGEGGLLFQFTFEDPLYTGGTRPGVGVLRIDKTGKVIEHNWYYGVKPEDTRMFESILKKLEKIDPKLKVVTDMYAYNSYSIHYKK